MPAIRTLATKMWTGSKPSLTWDEYQGKELSVREAPGINYAGYYPKGTVLQMREVRPGETTDIDQIGWNYRVSFDIEARPEKTGTTLFSFDDATFWLSDPVAGRLGFSRDGYLYQFNYSFNPGEKAHVAIRGDKEVTRLEVNGRVVETLDVKKIPFKRPMYYISTFVFPLKNAGDSFNSKITNLKAEAL